MKKDEFIKNACKMGYCNKEQAEKYSEGKEVFTEDDYISVYEMVDNQRYKTPGHRLFGGGYTSKWLYLDGGSAGNR